MMKSYALALLAGATFTTLAHSQAPYIHLVDALNATTPADGNAIRQSISADGTHVVFASFATNLLPEAPGSKTPADLFWRDLRTNQLKRVNLFNSGLSMSIEPVEGYARMAPAVSADGRYVAFTSTQDDPSLGDVDGVADIYLRDMELDITELISPNFVGPGVIPCADPSISGDGRYICYRTVQGPNTGPIFFNTVVLHDRQTGQNSTVHFEPIFGFYSSVGRPFISQDGSTIAFLVNPFLEDARFLIYDVVTGLSQFQPTVTSFHDSFRDITLDATGDRLVFATPAPLTADDTNGLMDVYKLDLQTDALSRVSQCYLGGTSGWSGEPSISGNGRYVSFQSDSACMTDLAVEGMQLYVADLETGLITLQTINDLGVVATSAPTAFALQAGGPQSLSFDGELIGFMSNAKNLATPVVPTQFFLPDIGVYVRERQVDGPQLSIGNLVAGQMASLDIDAATPGGVLMVGYSLTGQGPFPSYWGLIDLTPPLATFAVAADGAGQVALPLAVPSAFAGQRIWMKALDLAGSRPSTTFMGVVQ